MLSLYIHIPFCEKKCFYCSFVVSVGQEQRRSIYLDYLNKESRLFDKQKVKTLYWGGGTPTFLETKELQELFNNLSQHFDLSECDEFTVEANPEGLDFGKLKILKSLGVTRISLGVQTFNDDYLKYLGRVHNSTKALDAFSLLRTVGFDNINVDLMYSFPQQTNSQIKKDIAQMGQLESEHLSLYTLTIEENSRFYVKDVKLAQEGVLADQYRMVCDEVQTLGFKQYEVSNFAKLGKESRHNVNYWTGGNYLGLGIGAHSHLDGMRWWNVSTLKEYFTHIDEGKNPIKEREELSIKQQFSEQLLFGLRMNDGIVLKALEEKFKLKLDSERQNKINAYIREGFLQLCGDKLQASSKGRLVLDEISSRLI